MSSSRRSPGIAICREAARALRLALTVATLIAGVTLIGCETWRDQVQSITQSAGLEPGTLRGTEFEHQVFHSAVDRSATLVVLLDGDGSPWIHGGTRVSGDPTPRNPLALELAARTPGAVLYLGRPCYFGSSGDPGCEPGLWTSARYSSRVVHSMASALNRFIAEHGVRDVTLVGYSGGGTLALLMAPEVPSARAVVTVAANLDIDAWTQRHGYLPLVDSLNPVNEPPLPPSISEWHIVGARDRNVPRTLNRRYWTRVADGHIWMYDDADHACCWAALWPQILARLESALETVKPRDAN